MRFLILFTLGVFLSCLAEAQTRKAFIVGVGNYDEIEDLPKTLGDANGYSDTFENALGFQVTRLLDPTFDEFFIELSRFVESIQPNDEIAFIFSGHGWSDGGQNYLALKDAPFQSSELRLKRLTAALNADVIDEIRARHPSLVFAVVDACRNNPFDLGTKSGRKGLVRQSIVPGTLVVYAAGANQEALERLNPEDSSPYSVFTRTLLPKLKNKQMPLMRAIDKARAETANLALSADHEQRPAVYSDISLDFCFSSSCRIAPEEEPWSTGLFPLELDAVGLELEYSRTYGTRQNDEALDIAPAPGGGAILTGFRGSSSPYGGGDGHWVIRVDSAGQIQWERLMSGADRLFGKTISIAPGGGAYTLAETGRQSVSVYRFNSTGAEAWKQEISGVWFDENIKVATTTEGSAVFAIEGRNGVEVIKLDQDGNQTWRTPLNIEDGQSPTITVGPNGHAFAGGTINAFDDDAQIFVMNLNAAGQTVWSARIPIGSHHDEEIILKGDARGGVFAAGRGLGETDTDDEKIIFSKIDASGNLQWTKAFDVGTWDWVYDVLATSDGGAFIVANTTRTDTSDQNTAVLRIDSAGRELWRHVYGGEGRDEINRAILTTDGGIMMAGSTTSEGLGEKDLWLVKLTPDS
nr:caspase family protein [uncultured Hyphomonas sp.]